MQEAIKYTIMTFGGIALLYIVLVQLIGLTIIGSKEVGVVQKFFGSDSLQNGHFIALNGEAGFQPDILRAGLYFRPRFLFRIHRCSLVTIPQGQIGYVFARDGKPLNDGQVLATDIGKECANFQNTREFLEKGGQKGPQRAILREGTYAFNLGAFVILTEAKNYFINIGNNLEIEQIETMSNELKSLDGFKPIVIKQNMLNATTGEIIEDPMAIITVQDGIPLDDGEIIAPIVGSDYNSIETFHNDFQNAEAFIQAGGRKGKQEQTLSDGTYYINRKFATVQYCEKTKIDEGYVGVVISYTGKEGKDISGDDYKHGQLVEKGCRGVWAEAMKTGKYAFNTSAGKIVIVPTKNFTLKWIESESSDNHDYDENLKEITLITKDAFSPTLPLSVVIHIKDTDAPYIIQTFGSVKDLVEHTLDPMISAYFRNIVQDMTLLELIQKRTEIQKLAKEQMKIDFRTYNLELGDVLIGTPSSHGDKKIQEMLTQLSDRQLNTEKVKTYESSMEASKKEKELNEIQSKTARQAELTESEINIQIQNNTGKAELERAKQDAEKKKTLSDADAYQKVKIGTAEAEMKAKTGIAESIAIAEKVKAYGGSQTLLIQDVMGKFTDAIKEGNISIVPKNVVTMGNTSGENGNGTNAIESLLGILLSKELGIDFKSDTEDTESVKKLKEEILGNISHEDKKENNLDNTFYKDKKENIKPKEATKEKRDLDTINFYDGNDL